jgi:hypothetical protein
MASGRHAVETSVEGETTALDARGATRVRVFTDSHRAPLHRLENFVKLYASARERRD